MKCKIFFISGIDTDSGKTIATGLIALSLKNQKHNVITQKIIQTGCKNISNDIITHRKIMNEDINEYDIKGLTCPYIFNFPASPHLSAKLENKTINTNKILLATNELKKHFEYLLLEGVGGLFVPINNKEFVIDYIVKNKYPLILVTSGKLGSINHTILSLEAIMKRKIKLIAIIYNNYFSKNKIINKDSKEYIKNYTNLHFPKAQFIEIGNINKSQSNFEITL